MIVFFAPIMLLGLPFVLINRRRSSPRGFEVIVDAEKRQSSSSGINPTTQDPLDDRPRYSDRPPFDPR